MLRQGNHLIGMAEAALQFEKDIEKNILLLPTAPTYRTDMLHRRLHQAGRSGVVLVHERYLTGEQVSTERGPIATGRPFRKASQERELLLGLVRLPGPGQCQTNPMVHPDS